MTTLSSIVRSGGSPWSLKHWRRRWMPSTTRFFRASESSSSYRRLETKAMAQAPWGGQDPVSGGTRRPRGSGRGGRAGGPTRGTGDGIAGGWAKDPAPLSISLPLLRRTAGRPCRPMTREKTDARDGVREGDRGQRARPAAHRRDDRDVRGDGEVQRGAGEGR